MAAAEPISHSLAESAEVLRRESLKLYVCVLGPAVLIMGCWAALRYVGGAPEPNAGLNEILGPAVFIAAVVAALALPLLIRAKFVNRMGDRHHVEFDEFRPFFRLQTALPLLAAYPAAAGYLLGVSTFHFSGTFLAALYAAYYFFPSETRVRKEMRLFRVGVSEDRS